MHIKERQGAFHIPTEIEEHTTTTTSTWTRYELVDSSLIKKYFPSIYENIKKRRKLKD